ncbi:CBS domain-containing protein [Nocardia brasiliensis]|uniref:CBS domain-containing protein n=1 Tax=Nocardia brasiliensis TaxID=37326 RepID=UPI001893E6EA|nr:CBS domain-containing protein [Nocardia brasiliensis]MBF6541486.1 CBS domain-containing protein [Nocardia brasiliensis]
MADAQHPSMSQLLALKGTALPMKDLLALFGFTVRNFQSVPAIADALRDAGLTTSPSFATCGTRTELLILEADTIEPVDAQEDADQELAPGTLPQHSFKVGDLASATRGITSITSTNQLSLATHLMRSKNYSQIPVIDGTSDLKGVVTWRSIARLYELNLVVGLSNAMDTSAPVAEVHQDLFPHLPSVYEHGYLLVRSNSGVFTGIITAADITSRFQATALPFFLVGEIEFQLRKCLGAKIDPDAIRTVQKRRGAKQTGDISDLMFMDYIKLLRANPGDAVLSASADCNWAALSWNSVDRSMFVHQLDRVRQIRNTIAHFDAEPLSPDRIDTLREFSGLLRQLN